MPIHTKRTAEIIRHRDKSESASFAGSSSRRARSLAIQRTAIHAIPSTSAHASVQAIGEGCGGPGRANRCSAAPSSMIRSSEGVLAPATR